ncbi:class I glutamine amidotransferase-like protein [Didymella exigua CBS 183.55]|uniref:Class I glutamine amidotransferase-like protein n=1 Tax=Didymella exigua CBS 183.55 TaxID=1150837 RepID=A0A6A5RLG5_9PLEO|nr:class I glutamine amidotransferase-like protein [Didymella exigua CBS 183.55]KAF1929271.1 class I glutamine amidotransferase-like protein [Didymella exigua CBS 183.55]
MRVSHTIPLIAALPSAFAAPQQPPFTNTTELPTRFAMLLLPHFQALDVFGPLDVLNTLSMLYGNQTAMNLTLLSKTMDPVGTTIKGMHGKGYFGEEVLPTETFANILGKKKSFPAKLTGGHGQTPTQSYDTDGNDGWGNGYARRHEGHEPAIPHSPPMNHTMPMKDIEVLLVPGGGGTRQNMTEEIAFVKAIYPKLKYIISICTGATLLSRAGLLDGRKATTNKRAWAWATSTGPNVTWVPSARWVEDGNIFTSSGISAGIDVTIAWVGRVYGEEVADYLANSMEYERWTDPHKDPFAKVWDVPGTV